MDTETETNPVGGEDTGAPILDTEMGVETEVQFDDDGNPIEEPDEEEIELDEGLKLKVSKDAAAKLKELREGALRQADYTRKTQELAEQRRAFQQEREQFGQLSESELAARAEVHSIDAALKEYQQIDWRTWQERDPVNAAKAFTEYQLLKDQRQVAAGKYSQAHTERTLQQQREAAERLQQGQEVLAKEIPGWGEDKAKALLDFGQKQLGFSAEELNAIDDPRVIVALHYASEGVQARTKQQAVQRHETAQKVQPAASVKAKSSPPTGLDDRLGADEWVRRRNEQLRKRG